MFAAVNVDTAESDRAGETTVGGGNDEHRRWKRRCPGRSRLEKRFGTTDRAERRAYAGGTDPGCTAEWEGGASSVGNRFFRTLAPLQAGQGM